MFTARLADFVCSTQPSGIPDEVIRRVGMALIDTVGVALAGSGEPVVDVALRQAAAFGGRGEATVLGYDVKLAAPDAAFVNSIAAHILDFDDSLPTLRGHPSGPVLAAALAAASLSKASGREFLASYALAVETGGKLGRVLGHGHYFRGWHTTATVSVFTSAAAAGRILGLDPPKMRIAFGFAAASAAGLLKSFGTMAKSWQVGRAAHNGFLAAWLASQGATASDAVFDGADGFFGTYSMGDGKPAEEIAEGIGFDWEILQPGISFKRWPCCYGAHRAIGGVLQMVQEHDIRPEEVESIDIGFGPNGDRALRSRRPKTGLEAKFSFEYPVAAAIIDRAVGFDSFTDARVNRPQAQRLIHATRRVQFEGEGVFTAHVGYNDVTIRTRRGDFFKRVSQTPGSPTWPMSPEEMRAKFLDCAGMVQDAGSAQQLASALAGIAQADDVAAVFASQTKSWRKSPHHR
ncbi:MAG: MmgE/PrpD family protein [Betaproteobacteria bacterium]|nr:MAG: MmgE/PrpD family protein [Betaproteobacteria bacterium]